MDYERYNEPLPKPGDLEIVLDGDGNPRCVIRYTEMNILPFNKVSEEFALTEGEGFQSLKDWKVAHEAFFARRCKVHNIVFSEELKCVTQRFEVIFSR